MKQATRSMLKDYVPERALQRRVVLYKRALGMASCFIKKKAILLPHTVKINENNN
jgi:hypothetical protein